MEITYLVINSLTVLLGLVLCFAAASAPRLGYGLQTFLWSVAVLYLFGNAFFYIQESWLIYIVCAAALALAVLGAVWQAVAGALSGAFAVFTVGCCLMGMVFYWPENGTLGLLLALFGALLLGVVGALWPVAMRYILAAPTGALFVVLGVYSFVVGDTLFDFYSRMQAAQYGAGLLFYGIAAAVLWVAALTVQIITAARRAKRQKAAAADVPQTPPAVQPTEDQPLPVVQNDAGIWYCGSCGAQNHARFCTKCGTPRD